MYETCKSCGTIFDLDETTLSKKIRWLKCSVCNEKWSLSYKETSNLNNEKTERNKKSLPLDISLKDENEKVKQELASIKSAVEDKTKKMSPTISPVLDIKNKSVAEIASELSTSKLDTDNKKELKTPNKALNKKNNNSFYFILILSTILFSTLLFFRSSLLGYSYLYYPKYTEKYEKTILEAFNIIKLPILAELNYIHMTDFAATFQKENVKFSGVIKNSSLRPLLVPRIKVLAVREDRKILIEKIMIIKNKIILPSATIKFKDFIDIKLKNENVTVKATVLKKIFEY